LLTVPLESLSHSSTASAANPDSDCIRIEQHLTGSETHLFRLVTECLKKNLTS